MTSKLEPKRFIYRTTGVCPPEIHFKIHDNILCDIRFVGGGCPGNAQLVGRLLEGCPIDEIVTNLEGIDCRDGTSCPDQLAKAIENAISGSLEPAPSFKVGTDVSPMDRAAVIGNLGGRAEGLADYLSAVRQEGPDGLYCLGNLTGATEENEALLKLMRKEEIFIAAGELDWQYANSIEPVPFPPMSQKARDYLMGLPHVLSFQLGPKKAVGFFGDYIRHLPGFSDFDPFALEMNMVCDLSQFLKDEDVFPALEAMTPQFSAQVVFFSQTGDWGHWRIGDIDFISVGDSFKDNKMSWCMVEIRNGNLNFEIKEV